MSRFLAIGNLRASEPLQKNCFLASFFVRADKVNIIHKWVLREAGFQFKIY